MTALTPTRSLAEALAAAVGLPQAPAISSSIGSPTVRWARSGVATLVGPAGGSPALPHRDYAGRLQTLLDTVRAFAGLIGADLDLGMEVFSARAGEMGLSRGGRTSANGTARLIQTTDGWLAVNLARPEDRDSVPAWIGCDMNSEPWAAVDLAARTKSAAVLAATGQELGVPVSVVAERDDLQWRGRGPQPLNFKRRPSAPPPFMGEVDPSNARGRRGPAGGLRLAPSVASLRSRHLPHEWGRSSYRVPLVIDLSSLWAGPSAAIC